MHVSATFNSARPATAYILRTEVIRIWYVNYDKDYNANELI